MFSLYSSRDRHTYLKTTHNNIWLPIYYYYPTLNTVSYFYVIVLIETWILINIFPIIIETNLQKDILIKPKSIAYKISSFLFQCLDEDILVQWFICFQINEKVFGTMRIFYKRVSRKKWNYNTSCLNIYLDKWFTIKMYNFFNLFVTRILYYSMTYDLSFKPLCKYILLILYTTWYSNITMVIRVLLSTVRI